MTGKAAVTLASLVYSYINVSLFLEQPLEGCSPAPRLASWLFFLSMILLISDIEVYPKRYASIPETCRIFAEFLITLLFMELGIVIIWCPVEKLFYKLMKCILMENSSDMYYDMGGDALVGVIITIFSFCVFASVSLATGFYYYLKFRWCELVKMYCDRKQRVISRLSICPRSNACLSQLEIDSDSLCTCPPIQTRSRRARKNHNCTDTKSRC